MSMSAPAETTALPDIYLSAEDYQLLDHLLGDSSSQGVAGLLRREIDRAKVVPGASLPRDAVGLYRWAHYVEGDGPTAGARRVRLVLPLEADIDKGAVSVLSHVGAGLLGLREGQTIDWPDPSGRTRRLTPVLVEDPETPAA